MDRLWSPWRYKYVSNAKSDDACIFCSKASQDNDEANLILFRGDHNYVLLNTYPYTNGHLMVAPYEHISAFESLPAPAAFEMMSLAQQAVGHLKAAYNPQGINLGMNLGQCAGAGIAGHLHLHILPRWYGDASFMTTIAETRVLPEDLTDTWRKLQPAFK